jgi:hypothetical protein
MACQNGEIADSDGESEIDVAPSLPQPPFPARVHQGETLSDIDLGVNFSDFLSQSQQRGMHGTQLSVAQEEHLEGVEKSTGTTASLQRQIESEQRKLANQKSSSIERLSDTLKRPVLPSSESPIVAKTKRRHSELVATEKMNEGREAKRRRERTYGSSSSRLRSSQPDIFTEYPNQFDENMADLGSGRVLENSPCEAQDGHLPTSQRVDSAANFGQDQIEGYHHPSNKQSALHDHDDVVPQRIRELSTNPDAFKEYVQTSAGHISTSRSLMGNYESINLDFSGSGRGLDINVNPFGDASQQSLADGHTDPTEGERLEARFIPHMGTGDTVPYSSNRDTYTHDPFRPLISGNDGAASLREENQPRLASSRSKSFIDPSVLMRDSLNGAHELVDTRSSSPLRKRRKTADGLASSTASAAHEADSIATTIATPGTPSLRTETQGKKRGRKPKNQNAEVNAVVLPKQSTDCSEIEDRYAEKLSSELHLEDESTIGLPQEQYKPRPSRSRSKQVAEEMPPPSQSQTKSISTPVKQPQPSTGDDMVQSQEVDDTPLTKLKKEKRKKNKMKRAKTSAAALLKKSDKMLSDGEEDVVWVDTKPAAVKMRLPDPLEVKREESVHQPEEEVTEKESNLGSNDTTDLVAKKGQPIEATPAEATETAPEIPPEDEGSLKAPPKKRGRKKKIAVEIPISYEGENGETKASDDSEGPPEEAMVEDDGASDRPAAGTSSTRQALREQDVNIIPARQQGVAIGGTPMPLAATECPSTHHQQLPASTVQATPCKETNNRGPTKHSPINPAGGKVKYRVGLSRRATIPPLLKILRK